MPLKPAAALVMSNSYTNESVKGAGAVKGAPCQVKNISKVGDLNTVTFSWSKPDGSEATGAMIVKDGVSIIGIIDNKDGTFKCALSDGTFSANIATVRGPKGDQGLRGERGERGLTGERGPAGERGLTGERGEKGDPGVSPIITQDTSVSGMFYLEITDANGKQKTPNLKGIKGDQGLRGERGERGETGPRGLQGLQGIRGEKGDDGYPFLIYKQYEQTTDYKKSDFKEIGLMFMIHIWEKDDSGADLGFPIYRYTGGENYNDNTFVCYMNTEGVRGPKGDPGESGPQGPPGEAGQDGKDGITYTPKIGTVTTVAHDKSASVDASVDEEKKEVTFNFEIPKGLDGNGYSAYELAVQGGYSGTLAEWLESLKGKDGKDGEDGLSAYELAVEEGYTGTLTEWLESLKGKDGEDAPQIKDDTPTTENPYSGSKVEDVVAAKTGDLSNLDTTDKSTIVNAVNEVNTNLGDKADKSDLAFVYYNSSETSKLDCNDIMVAECLVSATQVGDELHYPAKTYLCITTHRNDVDGYQEARVYRGSAKWYRTMANNEWTEWHQIVTMNDLADKVNSSDIVKAFSNVLSDNKIPSEKLVKTAIDTLGNLKARKFGAWDIDDLENYPKTLFTFDYSVFDANATGTKPFVDGHLITFVWSNTDYHYITQIAIEDENYEMYIRNMPSGEAVWRPWVKIPNANDISSSYMPKLQKTRVVLDCSELQWRSVQGGYVSDGKTFDTTWSTYGITGEVVSFYLSHWANMMDGTYMYHVASDSEGHKLQIVSSAVITQGEIHVDVFWY